MSRRYSASLLLLVACSKPTSDPAPLASSSATPVTPLASASASALAPASASASAFAPASASASPAAPSLKTFPGTEAGAKSLLAEFVKRDADTAGLAKQLRPTTADYKAIFDLPTATKLDRVYSKEWERGSFIVAPASGQTEVKLFAATIAELKANTGKAKDFPSYQKMGPHLTGSATIYRFQFVEPGKEQGNSYDGLTFVNAHWVLIPKPLRGMDEP